MERETERQRQEMELAALHLGRLPTPSSRPRLAVHLMSGRRFWYQTAFCLHSLARSSGALIEADIYDDGTIDPTIAARFASLGPNIRIHYSAELRHRLDTELPIARFPTLRERWDNYPNIRKLIDVHLGSSGWKLVIDSDLLFFRRPEALLQWAASPGCPLVATDCEESYGYSRSLMESLAGAPIPPLVNVGLCALQSDRLNWSELEQWTSELQRREKTNYYLEQALVAMLVARTRHIQVAGSDYVTKPSRDEVVAPRAVMHHYVANAKRWYFRMGWRHFLET